MHMHNQQANSGRVFGATIRQPTSEGEGGGAKQGKGL